MMSDDQIIAVVQARREGKRIQAFNNDYAKAEWYTIDYPKNFAWDFCHFSYRVAPEPRKPREWVMGVDQWGRLVSETYGQVGGAIRVREVPNDSA